MATFARSTDMRRQTMVLVDGHLLATFATVFLTIISWSMPGLRLELASNALARTLSGTFAR